MTDLRSGDAEPTDLEKLLDEVAARTPGGLKPDAEFGRFMEGIERGEWAMLATRNKREGN